MAGEGAKQTCAGTALCPCQQRLVQRLQGTVYNFQFTYTLCQCIMVGLFPVDTSLDAPPPSPHIYVFLCFLWSGALWKLAWCSFQMAEDISREEGSGSWNLALSTCNVLWNFKLCFQLSYVLVLS